MHMIRAELSGYDTCTALGITVQAAAPVLAMCRKLIEAGYDPDLPLHAYRGETLCLTVSSIGYGAKYTVADNRCGTPVLCRYRPQSTVAASHVRFAAFFDSR
jgi:hypothetical protein